MEVCGTHTAAIARYGIRDVLPANVELLSRPHALAVGQWHRVKIEFRGPRIIATVDDMAFTATHDCIAEEKLSLGLGGDSGGPEGEKAGALEFRKLRIDSKP